MNKLTLDAHWKMHTTLLFYLELKKMLERNKHRIPNICVWQNSHSWGNLRLTSQLWTRPLSELRQLTLFTVKCVLLTFTHVACSLLYKCGCICKMKCVCVCVPPLLTLLTQQILLTGMFCILWPWVGCSTNFVFFSYHLHHVASWLTLLL